MIVSYREKNLFCNLILIAMAMLLYIITILSLSVFAIFKIININLNGK